jgi:hypothetical protein
LFAYNRLISTTASADRGIHSPPLFHAPRYPYQGSQRHKSVVSCVTHVTRHLMIHIVGLLELSVQKFPTELKPTKQTGQTCFAYNQWRCMPAHPAVGEGKPTKLPSQLSYVGRFWKI